MKKNDEFEIDITDIGTEGEGIVYVSCDSATLARDLKILCDGGYEIRCCSSDYFRLRYAV